MKLPAMRKSRFLLLLMAGFALTACHKDHNLDLVPNPHEYKEYKDVLYATDTAQQTMDVYLPPDRDDISTPVVVLIHGGGWRDGDKKDFDGQGIETFFISKGWAVVNMNYRLDDKYSYPAPIYDIGQVLEYIKLKQNEWNINPDRICLLGRSAGAHLALTYAYSHNNEGRIKAVIDGYGPTNFTDSTVVYNSKINTVVNQLLGDYSTNEAAWQDASPINHTDSGVPTVIFQSTDDSVVFYKQASMLQESLLQYGVPCMFVTWQGYGHGWVPDEWNQWQEATYEWVKRFL